MADSDAPETGATFVQACGSPLGRIAAPPLHCTRPRGHDGDHADGAGTWRDPDPGPLGGAAGPERVVARLQVLEGGGTSKNGQAGIAGGQLTGKGGAGPSTDFGRGFVIGGSLAGCSSPGGGSATGFASGGIGGGASQNPNGGSSTFVAAGGVAGAAGGSAYAAGSYGGRAGGSASTGRCGAQKMFDRTPITCTRDAGHYGAHDDNKGLAWSRAGSEVEPARPSTPPIEPVAWRDRATFGATMLAERAAMSATKRFQPCGARNDGISCERLPGHDGAHGSIANGGVTWSAAPPLGPVPERFRTMPRAPELEPFRAAVDAKPGLSEVLLAGLVACGRALGRIDGENAERRRWQAVLAKTDGRLDQGERWSEVGPALFEQVKAVACSPPSEPSAPIQERAEALAILIMRGQVGKAPPNALIRAGVAFEVLRSAWRKAKRGGT